jgi:hypothetical protein
MHYSKCMLAAGLWSVLTISCAQTQTDTAQRGATETETPKTEVDSKAIESYWTKEKMEKAKPMPTPTVIIDPNAPETSPPDVNPDGQGAACSKTGRVNN